MNSSDDMLKQDIENELRWDAVVRASAIGVRVNDGVVWLAGTVDTYEQKFAALDAVKRVRGVHLLREDLRVQGLEDVRATGT